MEKKKCIFLNHGKKHDVYINTETKVKTTLPRHADIDEELADAANSSEFQRSDNGLFLAHNPQFFSVGVNLKKSSVYICVRYDLSDGTGILLHSLLRDGVLQLHDRVVRVAI